MVALHYVGLRVQYLLGIQTASMSTNYAFKLIIHVQGPCTLSKAKGCKTQDGVKGKQSILMYT